MADVTDENDLPYATVTDAPFVHLDMQSLAETLDELLVQRGTSLDRPAVGNVVQPRMESAGVGGTRPVLLAWNGSSWEQLTRLADGGDVTLASNASGDITIPHDLGITPTGWGAQVSGWPGSNTGTVVQYARLLPMNADGNNIVVRAIHGGNGTAIGTTSIRLHWWAIVSPGS